MSDRKPLLNLDLAIFEKNGKTEFAQLIKKNRLKTSRALNDFLNGVKDEAIDSKEATRIIVKFVVKQEITKNEEQHLKEQVYDLFKILGIGIPFMLIPGATLLIPFIIKAAEKKGIDLVPSNFRTRPIDEIPKNKRLN